MPGDGGGRPRSSSPPTSFSFARFTSRVKRPLGTRPVPTWATAWFYRRRLPAARAATARRGPGFPKGSRNRASDRRASGAGTTGDGEVGPRRPAAAVASAALLEGEAGDLLRDLEVVLVDLPRDERRVAEVEMHVVVRPPDLVAVGHHPPVVGELLRHAVVCLDRGLVAQHDGPDAVEVDGGPPHVRGGAHGELVRRRAVAAVDGDVQGGRHRVPEPLQVEGEQPHPAGHVARVLAQPLRLLEVDEEELVEAEVMGHADVPRRLVAGDLVEVARQAVLAALLVLRHLVGAQQRPDLGVEVEGVDDLEAELAFHARPDRTSDRGGRSGGADAGQAFVDVARDVGYGRAARGLRAELREDHEDVRLAVVEIDDAGVVMDG